MGGCFPSAEQDRSVRLLTLDFSHFRVFLDQKVRGVVFLSKNASPRSFISEVSVNVQTVKRYY